MTQLNKNHHRRTHIISHIIMHFIIYIYILKFVRIIHYTSIKYDQFRV